MCNLSMAEMEVREVECSNCHSTRAILPDNIDPIRCYSCDTSLDRAQARPPLPSALQATKLTRQQVILRAILTVAIAAICGAVMFSFYRLHERQAKEALRWSALQVAANRVCATDPIQRTQAEVPYLRTPIAVLAIDTLGKEWTRYRDIELASGQPIASTPVEVGTVILMTPYPHGLRTYTIEGKSTSDPACSFQGMGWITIRT